MIVHATGKFVTETVTIEFNNVPDVPGSDLCDLMVRPITENNEGKLLLTLADGEKFLKLALTPMDIATLILERSKK